MAVQHFGGIFICCLFCQIVKQRVVISDKNIELNGEIIECVAESSMNGLFVIAKPLPVSGCRFSFTPGTGYFNTADTIDDQGKREIIRVISHLPVKHMLDLMVTHARNN